MTENYFRKKFTFKSVSGELPAEEVFFSANNHQREPSLEIIRSILNHVKSKLNEFRIEQWSLHTRARNPAQQILHFMKSEIRGEFVTQAFCKFFECLSAYPMVNINSSDEVQNQGSSFNSIHLCECPGGFIAALNHYLMLHHPDVDFKWRASTLNPYFEGNLINNTILDDRLISHTLENWIFGEDYDGDILKESNIRSLISYCKSFGKIDLVTGDGSVDCLDQPENQEEIVSKLHMAEFIVSLAILSDGGSMLIKMFTFFESSSIAMLYILSCCFEELHIFKPATSKEGNSEVYVIGLGYKKEVLSDRVIEKMISDFKDETKTLLRLDAIPKEFLQQVIEAARFFMNLQVGVIEGNIRTFKRYDKNENYRLKMMKYQIVEEFQSLYKVSAIREDQKLLHGLHINNDINLNERVHLGSHSERLTFFNLSRHEQYQVFFDRLRQFYDSIMENALNSSCFALSLCYPENDPREFLKLIHGRPVEKIGSSKFILVSLVKYFNELRKFLENVPEKSYYGPSITTNGNHFIVDSEYFRRASSYDVYEKDVVERMLKFMIDTEAEMFIIEGLPLLTQFLVGVTMFLAKFVFDGVHLKRVSGTISFKSMTLKGRENIELLLKTLTEERSTSNAVLGICDTKNLFSNSQFYKSVIDFNNHLCLKFCSLYLNISSL